MFLYWFFSSLNSIILLKGLETKIYYCYIIDMVWFNNKNTNSFQYKYAYILFTIWNHGKKNMSKQTIRFFVFIWIIIIKKIEIQWKFYFFLFITFFFLFSISIYSYEWIKSLSWCDYAQKKNMSQTHIYLLFMCLFIHRVWNLDSLQTNIFSLAKKTIHLM